MLRWEERMLRWLGRNLIRLLTLLSLLLATLPALHFAALIQFRYRFDPKMPYYQQNAMVVFLYGPGPDHGIQLTPKPQVTGRG